MTYWVRQYIFHVFVISIFSSIVLVSSSANTKTEIFKSPSCKLFDRIDQRPKRNRDSIQLRCGPVKGWYAYVHDAGNGNWLTLARAKYVYSLQDVLYLANRPKNYSFPLLQGPERQPELIWIGYDHKVCYLLVAMQYQRVPATQEESRKLRVFAFDISRSERAPRLMRKFDSMKKARAYENLQLRCDS